MRLWCERGSPCKLVVLAYTKMMANATVMLPSTIKSHCQPAIPFLPSMPLMMPAEISPARAFEIQMPEMKMA